MNLTKIRNFFCSIGGSIKYLDTITDETLEKKYPISVYSYKYNFRLKAAADLLAYLLKKYDLEIIHKNHFFGYRYYIDTNYNLRFFLKYKFPSDSYPIMCFLKRIQVNWTTAFDLGANKGLITCFLAQKAKKVFSFEPGKDTSIVGKRNLTLNQIDNVAWNELAVGNKNEKLRFYDWGIENSGHNSLIQLYDNPKSVYDVEVIRIEDYCKTNNISYIDFMKIDIEGYEKAALDGCGQMLSNGKIEMIILEVSPQIVQSWAKEHAMLQQLMDLDYRIFNLYLEALTIEKIEGNQMHQDIVVIYKDCVEKYTRNFQITSKILV